MLSGAAECLIRQQGNSSFLAALLSEHTAEPRLYGPEAADAATSDGPVWGKTPQGSRRKLDDPCKNNFQSDECVRRVPAQLWPKSKSNISENFYDFLVDSMKTENLFNQ